MKFSGMLFLICIFISAVGCSKNEAASVIYLNGDVNINGIEAKPGHIEGKEISINTGKNSSVIVQNGSKMIFALSEDTTIRINKNSVNLVTGRIIASSEDDVVVESREVSIKTEKSLFELISRSDVSVVTNYSGELVIKGVSFNPVIADGLVLSENFSIESVNGSLSPSHSIRTDVVRKNEPLKNLTVSDNPGSSAVMNKISPECISIINSRYGMDIEKRYSLKTLSSEHGSLSEITTKSGQRIIGAVLVSGTKMTIYTVTGDKVIPISDVKTMKRYNAD